MRSFKVEAVVLKTKNFGEADRILTIFSKSHGKLTVIAKGARRITSRKGPNLEVFNKVSLLLSSGKNFDLVTEASVIDSYEGLRKKLKLVGLAYNICELVDKLTPEKQEAAELYELIVQTLSKLSKPLKDKNLILNFKKYLLEDLGYIVKDESLNPDIDQLIESITEREIKSRKFLMRI